MSRKVTRTILEKPMPRAAKKFVTAHQKFKRYVGEYALYGIIGTCMGLGLIAVKNNKSAPMLAYAFLGITVSAATTSLVANGALREKLKGWQGKASFLVPEATIERYARQTFYSVLIASYAVGAGVLFGFIKYNQLKQNQQKLSNGPSQPNVSMQPLPR